LIRKFNKIEKPLKFPHCPECNTTSKRLCDINSHSNETDFVSPFFNVRRYDENGRLYQDKKCGECGYGFPRKYMDEIDDKEGMV